MRTLGFIFRNSKCLTSIACLKQLYFAYVRAKLEYASLIWGPIYQKYDHMLRRVERRFLKYLHFKTYGVFPVRGYDGNLLLAEFGFDSLESRRRRASLIFLYKIFSGAVDCGELLSQFSIQVPRFNSRVCRFFRLPAATSNAIVRSPIYVMSRSFNDVCHMADLSSPSLSGFMRAIQEA